MRDEVEAIEAKQAGALHQERVTAQHQVPFIAL